MYSEENNSIENLNKEELIALVLKLEKENKDLKEKNIIIETTGYSRNQVFAFQKYIDLFLK